MMYVSRHIYILRSALVNLALGIYLKLEGRGWRRKLQVTGSLLIPTSLVLLTLAFVDEPRRGLRGARYALHSDGSRCLAARLRTSLPRLGQQRIDRPRSGL
jgi:hypothetical protein